MVQIEDSIGSINLYKYQIIVNASGYIVLGDELGMFKSGSTVVLLFDSNVKLSTNLKRNKIVRVGNKIGEITN